MDRDGLADCLRRRRGGLEPGDVGPHPGRRGRTRGLRREEVAALAHMSTVSEHNVTERRVVFTAVPNSEDAERVELLSVIGSQQFSGASELAS